MTRAQRPLVVAGTLLGIGLGGFADGILFHQLLQLHHMLTASVPATTLVNVEINMAWDGVVHSVTWLITMIGVWLLFRAGGRRDVAWSGRTFAGALALGWGLFNAVEGLIDHHVLQLHHVVERLGTSMWDYAFLASGVALIAVGWRAIRGDSMTRMRSSGATGFVR